MSGLVTGKWGHHVCPIEVEGGASLQDVTEGLSAFTVLQGGRAQWSPVLCDEYGVFVLLLLGKLPHSSHLPLPHCPSTPTDKYLHRL